MAKLSPASWIAIAAIAVPVIVAAIVGLIKLLRKKDSPAKSSKNIRQKGSDNTADIGRRLCIRLG